MAPGRNTRILLASRPKAEVEPNTFKTDKSEPIPDEGSLKAGEVVVRIMYLSLDASMTTWLKEFRNYLPPVELGAVMRASGIGRVVASRCPKRKVGDTVEGVFGWQEYWKGPSKEATVLDVPKGATALDFLGPLGTSGLTAYFGLKEIGKLKDGDNIVISGAAGSVGLLVTQLALLQNPSGKVITIAGSQAKCKQLKDMGCYEAINYKEADWKKQVSAALKRKDGKGRSNGYVDVYFDNVGGEMLDFMLGRLNEFARVVMCGAISDYNSVKPYPVCNYQSLISTKSRMEGFIVFQFYKRYPEARKYMAEKLHSRALKYDYTVLGNDKSGKRGVEACVDGLAGLYEGKNTGKTVVQVWDGKEAPIERSKL